MPLSDAFWVSLAPTLAIIATGVVTWLNERRKRVMAEQVAEQTAVVAQRTEAVANKAEEIARRAEEVRETLAVTGAETSGKLQVIHELVNDRMSKALAEIARLGEELSALRVKDLEHTRGNLRTRAGDKRKRVRRG